MLGTRIEDEVTVKQVNGFKVKSYRKQTEEPGKYGTLKSFELVPYKYKINGQVFSTSKEVRDYIADQLKEVNNEL